MEELRLVIHKNKNGEGEELAFRCLVCGTSLIATNNNGLSKQLNSKCYICGAVMDFVALEEKSRSLRLQIDFYHEL